MDSNPRTTDGRASTARAKSSHEIEQEIQQTRHHMDETLDAISHRLRPRYLIELAMDLFQSEGDQGLPRQYAQHARTVGKQVFRKAKEHPIPTLLCGAGIAWLLYEEFEREERRDVHSQWADIPEHSGSFVDARTGEPYDESYGAEWKGVAWAADYDWRAAQEDEAAWNEQAERALAETERALANEQLPPQEKLRTAAQNVVRLSGRTREEIHAQWADIPEHSGSFVDARTGEPYDESYGVEFRHLMACDYAAHCPWPSESEPAWTEKAQRSLERMRAAVSDRTVSAKERAKRLAANIGSFVQDTGGVTKDYSQSIMERARQMGAGMRRGAQRMGRGARHGAARMGRGARHGASEVGHRMQDAYSVSRDSVSHAVVTGRENLNYAVDQYPLAVGAACLGLGLIAGLLLPRSRREDEMMGEASDRMKHRARELGEDVLERGQHVVQRTADATMDELERQGLTPEQIANKARHVASEVSHTLQDEIGGTETLRQKGEAVAQRAKETVREEIQRERQSGL